MLFIGLLQLKQIHGSYALQWLYTSYTYVGAALCFVTALYYWKNDCCSVMFHTFCENFNISFYRFMYLNI